MGGESREALDMQFKQPSKSSTKWLILVGFVAFAMTVATIVLAVLYGLNVNQAAPETPPVVTTTTPAPSDTQATICESDQCVSAASRIVNAMNLEAQPCDDFFEYACGAWNVDHLIADDQSSVSTFNGLREDVAKILKRVLEKPITTERDSIKKAKNFYSSCMDTAQIDSLGAAPLKTLITEMGGWPVVGDSFDASKFDLSKTLGKFVSIYGTYGLVSMWVGSDDRKSTENIIQLDQPSLGMPNRDYYLDADKYAATAPSYRKYMVDMMTAVAGASADATAINAVADQIIDFEIAIASSMAPDSERRDSEALYNKMTIAELQTTTNSAINWSAYINSAMSVVGTTVTSTENVVIYAPEYLKNVTDIINGRFELVQNYLVWRVVKGRTSYLSSTLRATRDPYTQATSGTTSEPARWRTCSDSSNSNFPMPVGSLFVQDSFPEENKAATLQMVEDLRLAFKSFLPTNDWMDDQTKTNAETKADLINPIIGYPDYITDTTDNKMDQDYADVTVGVATYFDNIQSAAIHNVKTSYGKLRLPVDFEEWITSPAIVNAFYSPSRNQIVFPAGILQPPFYDAGQPSSMNYGAIGMVIGHEITHGFDNSGAQFDGYGNLNNWWSNSSKENFNVRSQCMIDQYSAISWDTAKGLHLNGENTLGENIADNGGIREAYEAYKRWQVANPGGDLRLPGLGEFTQDQLFFLGYAQVWCGTYKEEYAVRMLTTDPHSPGKFRVLVPSENFPEFGKAFNCKQGVDTMYPNPEDTCRVW
uniref:neprilysin-like isoform X1 n=2 Tax=Ciona intestinalis TaxID=7719 RepID=UPI0002B8D07E|nr:neprilysin-like isoform X1 [Ciona intestinalis]|eukprot:XP_002125559.4 neprilysin-like isoform X1 [Ciona intestinalis]